MALAPLNDEYVEATPELSMLAAFRMMDSQEPHGFAAFVGPNEGDLDGEPTVQYKIFLTNGFEATDFVLTREESLRWLNGQLKILGSSVTLKLDGDEIVVA